MVLLFYLFFIRTGVVHVHIIIYTVLYHSLCSIIFTENYTKSTKLDPEKEPIYSISEHFEFGMVDSSEIENDTILDDEDRMSSPSPIVYSSMSPENRTVVQVHVQSSDSSSDEKQVELPRGENDEQLTDINNEGSIDNVYEEIDTKQINEYETIDSKQQNEYEFTDCDKQCESNHYETLGNVSVVIQPSKTIHEQTKDHVSTKSNRPKDIRIKHKKEQNDKKQKTKLNNNWQMDTSVNEDHVNKSMTNLRSDPAVGPNATVRSISLTELPRDNNMRKPSTVSLTVAPTTPQGLTTPQVDGRSSPIPGHRDSAPEIGPYVSDFVVQSGRSSSVGNFSSPQPRKISVSSSATSQSDLEKYLIYNDTTQSLNSEILGYDNNAYSEHMFELGELDESESTDDKMFNYSISPRKSSTSNVREAFVEDNSNGNHKKSRRKSSLLSGIQKRLSSSSLFERSFSSSSNEDTNNTFKNSLNSNTHFKPSRQRSKSSSSDEDENGNMSRRGSSHSSVLDSSEVIPKKQTSGNFFEKKRPPMKNFSTGDLQGMDDQHKTPERRRMSAFTFTGDTIIEEDHSKC